MRGVPIVSAILAVVSIGLWGQNVSPAPPVTQAAITPAAASPQSLPQIEIDSFEKVWTTVRDSHWEKTPGGLDWNSIHAEFRPRIDKAASPAEARAITQEMLVRLKQTHFAIVPASVYEKVEPGTDAQAGNASNAPTSPGFDLRVLDGEAIVTAIDPGSPAERAGVRPGWIVASIAGEPLRPVIEQARTNPEIHELQLTRSLLARFRGAPNTPVETGFQDGENRPVKISLQLTRPPGELSGFGNLPPSPVWVEAKRIPVAPGSQDFVEYFRLNIFLDIPRVIPAFERAVKDCMTATCRGLILDLRGNPGGIGGMAMGMAGFLIDKANQRLGTMYMREATLNFVVNPRPEVYDGPAAILLDSNSASTSEIFAGGLQDLHRARVLGTRSAAAALPSLFERLPNGDGFQYAVANYISQGGKPLEGLGVTPDQEVRLTRTGLLAGHDAVVDAAIAWVISQTAVK